MTDFIFGENKEIAAGDFESKVPAELRPAYELKGDKYALNDKLGSVFTMFDGLAMNYSKTTKTLQDTQAESKARREEVAAWKKLGEAPDKVGAMLKELQDKVATNATVKPEEIRAAIEQEYAPKLDTLSKERDAIYATLETTLVEKEALAALAEHKGNAKLLMPVIKGMVSVTKLDNGSYSAVVRRADGSVRAGPDGNPLTLNALVGELRLDKDLAAAFTVETKSGTGTQSRTSQNPVQRTNDQPRSSVDKISAGLSRLRA